MRMPQCLDPRSCSHAKGHNSLVSDLDSASSYHQRQGFGTHMAMKGWELEVHTIVAEDMRNVKRVLSKVMSSEEKSYPEN